MPMCVEFLFSLLLDLQLWLYGFSFFPNFTVIILGNRNRNECIQFSNWHVSTTLNKIEFFIFFRIFFIQVEMFWCLTFKFHNFHKKPYFLMKSFLKHISSVTVRSIRGRKYETFCNGRNGLIKPLKLKDLFASYFSLWHSKNVIASDNFVWKSVIVTADF